MIWWWAFGLTVVGLAIVKLASPPEFENLGEALAYHLTHEKNPLVGFGRAMMWVGLIVFVVAVVGCTRGVNQSAGESCVANGGQPVGGVTGVVCVNGTPEAK